MKRRIAFAILDMLLYITIAFVLSYPFGGDFWHTFIVVLAADNAVTRWG